MSRCRCCGQQASLDADGCCEDCAEPLYFCDQALELEREAGRQVEMEIEREKERWHGAEAKDAAGAAD